MSTSTDSALSIVSQNPFRILGVFANASKKDITSNLSKIQAFLKVGKGITFTSDFKAILGDVIRTDDAVVAAKKSIERPIDKLKATLFWFVNETGYDQIALNHISAGNINQASEIWSKLTLYTNLLNLSVCNIIKEDYRAAAYYAEKLFAEHSKEVCALVDNTLSLNYTELVNLYLDNFTNDDIDLLEDLKGRNRTLFDNLCPSESWDKLIEARILNHLIAISDAEIAKSKAIKNNEPIERLRSGQFLISFAESILEKVKNNSRRDSVEFITLSDKFADEIRKCGIDYHNCIDEFQERVEIVLNIFESALDIAKSDIIIDKCQECVDRIHDYISKLPPSEVRYYYRLLKSRIDEYYTEPANVSSVIKYIADCAPYLMSIKTVLGENNEFYLNVSTRVASDALSDLIEHYNKIGKELDSKSKIESKHDYFNIKYGYKSFLKDAIIAMQMVASLDVSTDFRANRIIKNYTTIFEQALDWNIFNAITKDSLLNALKKYDIDKRDELEYYMSVHSLEDCYTYRKIFPDGKFSKDIKTKEEYYEYVDLSSLQELYAFKVRYPDTKYDLDVKKEEIVFKSCQTVDDYNHYLAHYSKYRQQALNRIDDLEYKHCNSIADYKRYIETHPNGRHIKDANAIIEEDRFWQMCKKNNSKKRFKEYIRRYPHGEHISEANQIIHKHNVCVRPFSINNINHTTKRYIIGIILVVILMFGWLIYGIPAIKISLCFIGLLCCYVGSVSVINSKITSKKYFKFVCFWIIGVTSFICGGLLDDYESKSGATIIAESLNSNYSPTNDNTMYLQFMSNPSKEMLEAYLEKFPNNGSHESEIIGKFIDSISVNGPLALLDFTNRFPDIAFKYNIPQLTNKLCDSLYQIALQENTLTGWMKYQSRVPDTQYRDSQTYIDKFNGVTKDLDEDAWERAVYLNSAISYARYLSSYPNGKHSNEAKKREIDAKVNEVMSGEQYNKLPSLYQTSGNSSNKSTINIYNNTSFTLTLLYSGIESKEFTISPQSRKSVTLITGTYKCVATVNKNLVQQYAGTERLEGGSYEVEYYIVNTRTPKF